MANLETPQNRFYKVMKIQSGPYHEQTWLKHGAHGVYTQPIQTAAHPIPFQWAIISPADGTYMQQWHINIMTKRWWQTSRQERWDHKHYCQNIYREKEQKSQLRHHQKTPKNSKSHKEIWSVCLKVKIGLFFQHPLRQWAPDQAEHGSKWAPSSHFCSHLSLYVLGDLSRIT